ncbi:flavin monoamine oxidase family protein [Paraburkholderia sp. C35]|uniref:flavin monoamine oxidase family protein n=1 Tax=Paraburkholderia sp. C35 TaxID=2126993 RepID=UPI00195137D4|nr:flavin monoamine oxidase family protein [Paraburkholderia sp. C35]
MSRMTATGMSRRHLLTLIGKNLGAAAMMQGMGTLGFAASSTYAGPVKLDGAPKGTRILVLGAGMAGLVAAFELKHAGYEVQVLEYNNRAGGRAWTVRGGDRYTELGGATQYCEFADGLYLNPGPWRIPYHHNGVLDYAKRLAVPLEPFIQVNYNAYLHSTAAFDGKPQRFRAVQTDYQGYVAELLTKAIRKDALDDAVSTDDAHLLLESLRQWGALDRNGAYQAGRRSSERRGYAVARGGGLMPSAVPSDLLPRDPLLASRLWQWLASGNEQDYQSSIFQPVGGMDRIANALYSQVAGNVMFHARVTAIQQDEHGVTVRYTDTATQAERTAHADWLVCTIPLSILSQIDMTIGPDMRAAIDAVPYETSVKIGLQFGRRFWEEDEQIFGGITHTDLPISTIGYPATGYGSPGPAVLLGAYMWGPASYEMGALPPDERIAVALSQGSQIHPQYAREYQNGFAMSWSRSPFTHGCFAAWTDALRKAHYANLCQIDGRIVLAGEHASHIPAWQEGAVLSSLDAITRLHRRIVNG